MEAYYAFVKKLVNVFENKKLDYAFTGALAVSFYGVPRTTSDVDVMIGIENEEGFEPKLVSALREACLQVEEREIKNALTSGYRIATLKDKIAPYSVDLILEPGRLDKKSGEIGGVITFFQSPESLIAAKLRMIKASLLPERSVKDREDVKAILAFTKVDIKAVKRHAQKENTTEIFKTLIESSY